MPEKLQTILVNPHCVLFKVMHLCHELVDLHLLARLNSSIGQESHYSTNDQHGTQDDNDDDHYIEFRGIFYDSYNLFGISNMNLENKCTEFYNKFVYIK